MAPGLLARLPGQLWDPPPREGPESRLGEGGTGLRPGILEEITRGDVFGPLGVGPREAGLRHGCRGGELAQA